MKDFPLLQSGAEHLIWDSEVSVVHYNILWFWENNSDFQILPLHGIRFWIFFIISHQTPLF